MAITYTPERKSRIESRERTKAQYKLIFALSFAFFLLPSALARIVDLVKSPFLGPRKARKSIFAEAREAANSVLPYAFMG